jgi:hypothetical protein
MKQYFTQQKIKQLIEHNLKGSTNWRPIKKVLLLHSAREIISEKPWSILTETLAKNNIQVVMHTFDGSKEAAKAPPITGVITTKNLNWLGFPKEEFLQNTRSQNFDLCIDIVQDKHHPLELFGLSLSGLPIAKIGNSAHPYHLVVQPVDGKISEAIATFIHILTASKHLNK